jgi:hypothetical protein
MKRFDMRVSLAVCFGLLLTAIAYAETGQVFLIGSGEHSSCGEFIATIGNVPPGSYRARNTASGVLVSENKAYQEWLMGFVSGFNYSHSNDLEQQVTKIDPAGLDLWMRNWCNQHPAKAVFEGASAFIGEMRSNR